MGFARLARRRLSAEFKYLTTGRPPEYLDPFAMRRIPDRAAGAVLCTNPLVVATAANGEELPLGLASHWGRRLEGEPVLFLVHQYWSMEQRRLAWEQAEKVRYYLRRFPNHRCTLLANTEDEAELFRSFGAMSFVANHNICVDEAVFRPLPDGEREFEALLNARMTPFKRHGLAREIERLALIYYKDRTLTDAQQQAYLLSVRSELPSAAFVNQRGGDPWTSLSANEVNGWLNKAHVGLCLSVEEGANYASMEYLLAGLPVVSTQSRGGRDRYFHRDDCIVCDPDARQIAEAVQALKSRHVPAVEIRNRVLTQVDHERAQYKERVESLIREWWPDQSAPIDVSKIKLIPRERSLADLDAELTRILEERVERALHTA